MINQKKDLLEKYFTGEETLPKLPILFSQISKMVEDPSSSNQKIANLIMKDQTMVSRILRLCNSAMYLKKSEITSLQNAITFLGSATIKKLILQISLVRQLRIKRELIPGFNLKTFWAHSIGTAYFTEIITEKLGLPKNENYYLGGLLHDVGKLLIYQYYPEEFTQILNVQLNKNLPDVKAESEILKFDHCQVGAFLFQRWNLNKQIIEAVSHHHDSHHDHSTVSAVVVVANLFAKAAGLCFPWDKKVLDILNNPAWLTVMSRVKAPLDAERLTFEIMDKTGDILITVNDLLGGG